MHANLISAIDLFAKSYAIVRRNLNVYALVYAVPAAMYIAGTIQLLDNDQPEEWDWTSVFGFSLFGPDSSFEAGSAILTIVLLVASIISYFLATVLNLRVAQAH